MLEKLERGGEGISASLKQYISCHTYLDCSSRDFLEKLQYAMPVGGLGRSFPDEVQLIIQTNVEETNENGRCSERMSTPDIMDDCSSWDEIGLGFLNCCLLKNTLYHTFIWLALWLHIQYIRCCLIEMFNRGFYNTLNSKCYIMILHYPSEYLLDRVQFR